MSKALEINIGANTREFVAGTKDMTKALGDVSDSLHDAVGDGDKFERQVSDNMREVSRDAKRTGDDIGDNAGRGFDRAKAGAQEFKQEALQNFGEVASSFDGTVQGVADGVQGTLGGAAIAIGGAAGVAVGLLGAVGGAVLEQFATTTEESKQRVEDMYDDMAQSRSDFLSEEFVVQAIQDAVKNNYDRIKEIAELTGVTEAEAARAFVTAGDDRNAVLDAANAKYQEQIDLTKVGAGYTDEQAAAASRAAAGYAGIVTQLTGFNGEQDTAINKVNLFKDATSTAIDTAIDKTADLKTATESFSPIPLSVDTSGADSAIQNFIGKSYKVRVALEGYTRDGQRAI